MTLKARPQLYKSIQITKKSSSGMLMALLPSIYKGPEILDLFRTVQDDLL